MIKPDLKFVYSNFNHCLAFGFGSGLAKKAPGTWGTLVAFPIYAILHLLLGIGHMHIFHLSIVLFAWGIPICHRTSLALGVHDFGGIVWDEIVAMLMVLCFAPLSIAGWIAAFVLFRFFDIVKPWPIKWMDKQVGGGFGIMLDDLVAAAFSLLVLQALMYWHLI